MQHPIDSEGRKWNLINTVDKVGRHTIQAYRNKWVAGKGSRIDKRISVGRLQDDGSIKVAPNFLKTFPDFEGKELYWGVNELLDKSEFEEQFADREKQPDITWSEDIIRYGVEWACVKIAEQLNILEDLEKVFGKEDAQTLLNLAYYRACGGTAMSTYGDWLASHWLPRAMPVDGRRISELLAKVNETKTEAYYALRHKRAKKRSTDSKLALTLSFDSTGISTYSNTIQDAAYGKAKQNPELEQVNVNIMSDHSNGEILYASLYEGSVNDKKALPYALNRMIQAGFDLENAILVTDRGYQSIYNTMLELKLNLKFIQGITTNEDCVKESFKRHDEWLNRLVHLDPDLDVIAATDKEHWAYYEDETGHQIRTTVTLHMYRNPERRLGDIKKTKREAQELVDIINEGKKADSAFYNRLKRYVMMDGSKAHLNYNALDDYCNAAGQFAIRTNCNNINALEALRIYRTRNCVEEGIDILKNWVGGKRFRTTENSYQGMMFVCILAETLRLVMRNRIRENVKSPVEKLKKEDQAVTNEAEKNEEKATKKSKKVEYQASLEDFIKLPYNSLPRLLTSLEGLCALKQRSTNAFTNKLVAKKKRDTFALLGVPQPPEVLYRFKY